jgi:exonuclease III
VHALWMSSLFACALGPPPTDGETSASGTEPTATETTTAPRPPQTVRVLTWNVEGLTPSASQDAAATVLARYAPDVVLLQEIEDFEADDLQAFAEDLGYAIVVDPVDNPFGTLHNAVLSRLPLDEPRIWTSDALSGDASANDLTRWPVAAAGALDGVRFAVVTNHWKSDFYEIDVFRRAVDGYRTAQAAASMAATVTLVCGDVNEELDEVAALSPAAWTSQPTGAPSDFRLGDDLVALLRGDGLPNDPFAPLLAGGLTVVDALQLDTRDATRDDSGRRLDYCFVQGATAVGEVYDSRDDDGSGLPKVGSPPARETSAAASDHFPVVVDLTF